VGLVRKKKSEKESFGETNTKTLFVPPPTKKKKKQYGRCEFLDLV
jgi:hypothetical protein